MAKFLLVVAGALYATFIFWISQDLTFKYFQLYEEEDYKFMTEVLFLVTAASYLAGLGVATMIHLL